VCVAFPGILDLGERNTLGLDAQCAAGYAVHHLLERVIAYALQALPIATLMPFSTPAWETRIELSSASKRLFRNTRKI